MAVIGWGKPKIVFGKIGGSWATMQNPVQNSTTLTTEKGEKQEALCEGGEVEDVKYDKNKYALSMTIRVRKDGSSPIPHVDGYVEDEYAVVLQPEDDDVPGIIIEKSRVSVEDGYSTTEGTTFIYTFDALAPATGAQVKHGVVEFTGTSTITKVEYTEIGSSTKKEVSLASS